MNKILLVEDDQLISNIYRNKLCVEGFEVEAALDGKTGFDMIRSFRPDAVILDLMLPGMSGVELIQKIRAEPGTKGLPLIVFSNTYLSSTVQEAWKAGATKCLSKASCTPRQLIDSLRHALSGNRPPPASGSEDLGTDPAGAPDEDAAIDGQMRQNLLIGFSDALAALRAAFQATIKADDQRARVKLLRHMFRPIHALTAKAGLAEMPRLAKMSSALEALLTELSGKPETITASSLRTVASAIDFLGVLCREEPLSPRADAPALVLVVDDEVLSRRAVVFALGKVGLKALSLDSAAAACDALLQRRFDLVVLDVDMPGLNGFELCAKLREMPRHEHTPVVFVTGLTDLESRAQSSISGGDDFIAKPFLFMELAVKALVHTLQAKRVPAQPAKRSF